MTNSYHLGVDVGVSRVHAATARHTSSGNERVEPCPLSATGDHMPALMWVSPEGDLEFGDTARERGEEHPEALVGGLRCRIGTGVPFVVAGQRILAEDAYAHLVASVVESVTDTEGVAPARVVLTHPVSWGAHRRNDVRHALESMCDVPVEMTPEAEAAAWGAIEQARAGEVWAIYDLGGTSLDTAIVRWEEHRWTVLAGAFDTTPIGGIDVDDAVAGRVLADAATAPGAARSSPGLRLSSVAAKESLSTDTDAVVTRQDDGPATVRLTRDDFESMIRGLLDRTVLTLRETMDDGGVTVDDISGVIVAGGSSRIPLVAEHLSAALGKTVVAEPDPAALIAMGAARSALRQSRLVPTPESSTDSASSPDSLDSPDGSTPAVLIPFVRPEQARLATYAWRLVVASLIVLCVVYLTWAFRSDSAALFGLGSQGESAVAGAWDR